MENSKNNHDNLDLNVLSEMTNMIPGVVYQFFAKQNGEMGFYFVSSKSEQIIGLKPELEGYLERFVKLIIPEEREDFRKSIEKSVKDATEWNYEGMLQKPSGEVIWFSGNSTPSPREGEIIFNGIVQDITVRKKAEEALKFSEEKFRCIVECSPVAKYYYRLESDDRLILIGANPSADRIIGIRHQELLGKTIEEAFPQLVFTEIPVLYRNVARGLLGSQSFEIPYNDDRFSGYYDVTVFQVGSNHIVVDFIDITERKQAAQALRESEEKYRLLHENAGIGIGYYTPDGIVLSYNRLAASHMNGTPEEFIGKSIYELFPKQQAEFYHDRITKACSAAGPMEYEDMVPLQSGNKFFLSTFAKVTNAEDTILGIQIISQDITERKQAELRLYESESQFRSVFEQSPVGSVFVGLDKRFFKCNPAFCTFLGYEENELIGKAISDVTFPDDVESGMKELKLIAEGKLSFFSVQKRYVRKDGAVVWGEVTISLVRDALGKPSYFLPVIKDITEQKLALEKIRANEIKLRAILDATPFPVAIVDLQDDNIQFWSKSAHTLFGHIASTAAEWYEIAYPDPAYRQDVINRWKPCLEEARSTGLAVNTGEYQVTCHDGSVRICELHAGFIDENLVVTFNDISEKKTAAEALAAEKERLAVTLRSIGDAVIATDMDGTISLMNKVAENLTGWSVDEATGKPLTAVFKIINEMTKSPIANPVDKVLSSGEIIELANHTLLVSRDGTERVIADSGAPIKDRDGKTIGVVLVFRDMTEKQKLLETTQNIQKLESIGVLAGGIAHDFNNLLGGIFGYIDLANEETDRRTLSSYLSKAMTTIDRARALTSQLLTFAKGGAPIRKTGHLFPFVQETAKFALSGSNVSCNFDVPQDLWVCNFDKNQIGQVIDNLVINAQQAMSFGGIIDLTACNIAFAEKEFPALSKGNYVRISIKDHGIGMNKELLPRIFDPFFTTKAKGHGLGLATCFSIVNKHDGCIDVESEPGKGSIFHVYLPASPDIVTATTEISATIHKGCGTFLIMDDEEVIRETVHAMLDSFGYIVVCKENGKDAVEFFAAEIKANRTFAGMIFDLTVPGNMGGKDAVAEIRKLNLEIPVFVASGYAEDPIMKNPIEYGFTDSICKPFKKSELVEMLNKHLKHQR